MSYVEQAVKVLRSKGWEVIVKDIPGNVTHKTKHLLWNLILSEQRANMPLFRANYQNARYAINSMVNTPAKDVDGKLTKDKSSERNMSLPQEDATHYGDAQDIIIYGKFGRHVAKDMSALGFLS